jgi:phosphoserine phosphatase
MVATEDLDSLLQLIVDRSMELLQAERASLFLYEGQTNELVSRIAAGEDEIRFPADRGIAGAVIQTSQTINVPDAYADERFNPEVDQKTGFHTRNILSVPLHDYEGGLVGVLQVLNKHAGAFSDYDISLAEALGAQAGVALQRARLIQHYLRKQEMERAMKIARDIQQGLLPDAAPSISGFDIAGFSAPADETGGDTYDFFALLDERWLLVVADASGHGIGPALVIAETRAMLRAISIRGCDLPTVLHTVNNLLAGDLEDGRFVTCFLGILDPAKAAMTYAAAGHGPMLFYDHRKDEFTQVPATGLPLGIMPETDYSSTVTHRFQGGDFAVITTDGFFEAANPEGELFGIERVIEDLRRDLALPAADMIRNLHQAVTDFTAGEPQGDDLTVIIVRKE